MLAEDVPKLMGMIPQEEHAYMQSHSNHGSGMTSQASTIFGDQDETPFAIGGVEGINAGVGEQDWIVTRSRHEYDQVFAQLMPQNGKISGATAKQAMIKSKLVGRGPASNVISVERRSPHSPTMYSDVYGSSVTSTRTACWTWMNGLCLNI